MTMAGMTAPGLGHLADNLRAAGRAAADLEATNLEVAQLIVARARPPMPRRTGAMAASTRASASATEARITVGVRYARPRLFGSRAGTRPVRVTPVTVAEDTAAWLPAYDDHAAQVAADAVKGV